MSLLVKLTGVPARLVTLIDVSELYFQHTVVLVATQSAVPNAGTTCGASLRCTRCVSFALAKSAMFAALYERLVEVAPVRMYSYDGPVMVEPFGFCAIAN